MSTFDKIMYTAAIVGGLSLFVSTYCKGVPEYRGSGVYSCEKYGDKISAKNGNKIATRDTLLGGDTKVIFPEKYMSLEEAVIAIRECERAFEKTPEMEK